MSLRSPIRTSAFELVVLLAVALLLQLVPGSYVARASGATNVGVVGFSGFGGDPDYRDAVFGRGRLRFFLTFFVANGPADNVVLTDQLPAGVTYVSDNLSSLGFPGGLYDRATNTVTWNLGTISRGPSDPLQLIVQTDPGVADGAMLTNTFSISTTTPQTTTVDDSVSDQFQVGFLPLQISEQTSYSCDAHAQNATTDRKSVDNGAPVTCALEGVGFSTSSTQGPAAPLTGQIASPNDVFTIGGVGVSGYADGAFNCASSATCLQGSASADATTEVRVQVTNPNPYSVRLHTITDMLVWAVHGNECTSPRFPGDAQVEAFRDAVASGCISAQLTRIHLDDCKTISCATFHSETTSWPDTSGPDPELDPAGVVQVNEQSAPPDSDPCSNGTFVGAGAQQQTIAFLGFDDATANGSTEVTTLPDGSQLIRSGYGRFSAAESFRVARCDAPVSAELVALVIRAHSPVDLLVTDANGHKVGFDASMKRVVADIPGAAYMGHGSEPQTVMIENPAQSSYDIKAIGTGSGSYTIDAETIDGAGNVIKSVQFQGTAAPGSEQTQQVNLAPGGNLGTGGDTTPPTTTTALSPLPNAAGWNKSDVTVMLAATDNQGGSGVRDIRFSLSGAQGGSGVVAGGVAQVIITAEGTTTLTYFATDNAGNAEASKTQSVRIDKTPPTISGLPAPGCTIWPPDHSLVRVATVTAADGLSGLAPGSPTVTGTSDDSPLRPGSGQTSADIVIRGTTIELRAERSGRGTGRVYTLTTTASDVAGNSTTATAVCTVPHDQG